jgi:hypothetical protein
LPQDLKRIVERVPAYRPDIGDTRYQLLFITQALSDQEYCHELLNPGMSEIYDRIAVESGVVDFKGIPTVLDIACGAAYIAHRINYLRRNRGYDPIGYIGLDANGCFEPLVSRYGIFVRGDRTCIPVRQGVCDFAFYLFTSVDPSLPLIEDCRLPDDIETKLSYYGSLNTFLLPFLVALMSLKVGGTFVVSTVCKDEKEATNTSFHLDNIPLSLLPENIYENVYLRLMKCIQSMSLRRVTFEMNTEARNIWSRNVLGYSDNIGWVGVVLAKKAEGQKAFFRKLYEHLLMYRNHLESEWNDYKQKN